MIVAASPQVLRNEAGDAELPDPVYGQALSHTWAWLSEQATGEPACVDFGIDALEPRLPDGDDLSRLCQDVRLAYPLLPAHLDVLAQTSPPPQPDPEISAFLHGTVQSSPDVTVVWRADLPEDDPDVWADRAAVQPPVTGEGCPVPIWELFRWLADTNRSSTAGDGGDIEGVDLGDEEMAGGGVVLRWRGVNDAEVTPAAKVKPGDTVLVPATYGSCDEHGWNPSSPDPVADIGDAVAHAAGHRPVLRLEALETWLVATIDGDLQARTACDDLSRWAAGEDDAPNPGEALERLAESPDVPNWLPALARSLAGDRRRRPVDARGAYAIVGYHGSGEDLSTADDRSSLSVEVTLAEHCAAVSDYAERFARTVGLREELISDLALAASLHDLGKADPRFQVWLHGGDEFAVATAKVPLAKSSQNPRNRAAIRRARERARYPAGARHEIQSLALMADRQPIRERANDWDLVQHLVASHHGFARPFVPVVVDPDPVLVSLEHAGLRLEHRSNHELHRLDSGIPERYWRLVRRYGWWGLAWLEAILRLADHRRSEHEQRQGTNGD